MTVYAIAQISIHDRDAYSRYQARFMEVFACFKGTLLSADENPKVVEGTWEREKLILMSFPDEEAFNDWALSPAYEKIAVDRKAGSTGTVILAKGLA